MSRHRHGRPRRMTPTASRTFVLLPGAGGAAWYWHLVVPLLEAAGHVAIAVDLPGDDPAADLTTYVDLAADAVAGRGPVTIVAQSMGGFTALPLCARIDVERLILVNAMIPEPQETASDWWENVGSEAPRLEAADAGGYSPEFDIEIMFLHDVDPVVAADGTEHQRPEADIAFEQPCPFDRWPDIPTTVIAGRDDRLFPLALQRRIARERLGTDVTDVPGGHLAALSQPEALAAAILAT